MYWLFLCWFLFLLLLLLQKLLFLILIQKHLLVFPFLSFHCPLFVLPPLGLFAHLAFHTFNPNLLKLLCDFPQNSVNTNIRPLMEGLLTHGTLIQRAGFPVSQDAALAEVVPTGDRYGIGEHIETDGAVHLLFGQVPSGGHS